jgi:uncharacterized protein YjiS (DUF1127 family)
METIMSTMTRPTVVAMHPPRHLAARLAAILGRWWAARMERRLERLAVRDLRAMGDRELRDIGVGRSEVAFAVRAGRERERDRDRFAHWL